MPLLHRSRVARWGAGALLLALLPSLAPARAAGKRAGRRAVSAWEDAEQTRERLEAIPAEARTRADYEAALDKFRAIYHENPADVHAPASVYMVAELLAERGRGAHDAKSLKAAVGQYEFLRTQYPASSLRVQALLAEAQIERNDLGDANAAKERYELLVKQAPRSNEAEEARAVLGQMGGQASNPPSRPVKPAEAQPKSRPAETASVAPSVTPPPQPLDTSAAAKAETPQRSGELALVTGIRHWSTPNYTRVVIDLGDNVTYEAARVPDPDRIYFDLHGTRLAPELVNKSFAVTDDGFLKRIRAAQFRDHMSRVVLDVNDVTEYSAFLLPNPYRLIIDVHGRAAGTRPAPAALPAEATVMKPGGELKASAPVAESPVPNTAAVRTKGSQDVASLSAEPDRVEATSRPTSKPISAVVDERAAVLGAKDSGPASGPAAGTGAGTGAESTPIAVASVPSSAAAATAKRRGKSKLTPADGVAVGDAVPAKAAVPTADGSTSLVRALGLKIGRIVIDAGHGGHDSGTLGVDGLQEKDVVLDVALQLGKLLHDRLGAEIIYTRTDDTFIPLETRTAIANKAQADLFLSIHANSSPDETARGVETYYLNFTSDPTALVVAARENAVSDQSIHQLSDLVKKIALKDKIEESREFASDVEQGLYAGLQTGNAGLKNRGVKKAPFVVLIGANMPSVLAEISFVSNPRDASQLRRPEYRRRVAESLYKGVAKYAAGLSSMKPPVERASGQ